MGIFGHMTASVPLKTSGDDGEPDPERQPPTDHRQNVDKEVNRFTDKVDPIPSATPSADAHFTLDASPTRKRIIS